MLEVRGLTLGYGAVPALEGVDLRVEAGEFVSLVGPSGSGKSTLLRAVAGLISPWEGEVRRSFPLEALGFLFQEDALLPWRTARENVALGLRIRGVPKRKALEEAEAWLKRLGLGGLEDRFPHQLSGGQRKRVALAQVLALRPRLLLMDEPTSALDPIATQAIEDLILELKERYTVVIVTHNMQQAARVSDRTLFMHLGVLVEEGPTEVIFTKPKHPYTEAYITGRFG